MARILVVEDVKFISKILSEIFEGEGHQVDVAPDGLQALEKARQIDPDLILTDIAMPGMDGLELTRQLKESNETRHVPVMIVSSRNDRKTMTLAQQAGVDEFVIKPFETSVLLEKAANLLGGFRMNFSIEVVDSIPVVEVLGSEVAGQVVDQMSQALETARGGGGRPMVLDLSRATKIASDVSDAVVSFQQRLGEAGGSLEVVPPLRGLGVRIFTAVIEDIVRVHEDRATAIAAARKACEPPPAAATGSPADGASELVVAERHGRTLFVRVLSAQLGPAELRAILTEAGQATHDVLLDLTGVESASPDEAAELGKLSTILREAGRSLRIANPDHAVVVALNAEGLDDLIMRGASAPSRRLPTARS